MALNGFPLAKSPFGPHSQPFVLKKFCVNVCQNASRYDFTFAEISDTLTCTICTQLYMLLHENGSF